MRFCSSFRIRSVGVAYMRPGLFRRSSWAAYMRPLQVHYDLQGFVGADPCVRPVSKQGFSTTPYSAGARTNAPNSFSRRSLFPSCSNMAPDGVSSSTGTYSPQRGHETICTTVSASAPSARPRRNLTPAQLPQSIRSRGFASHGTGILCPQPGHGSVFRLPLTRRAPKAPGASPGRSRPPSPRRRR